jgi:hypothetical protein
MTSGGTPSRADIELAFYERFFFSRDLEPYPVQEQAFERIFNGESVLVTVPTGTGKTLMAKAGLFRALQLGQTAIYTTPLRALTEEKYRELCEDFGEDNVGFATGDYKVNPEAPLQVLVAEILWNRIYGDPQARGQRFTDLVVMDEGHYFNDPERGYVWEQSIIGLHPSTQLVILSATVGQAHSFCQWVYTTRKIPMALVEGKERRVPLYHEYKETYLIDQVKALHEAGEVPAILFTFGRELCFERARVLKSCPRFLTDAERARVQAELEQVLLPGGLAPELKGLLLHGIGVHHAGILPRYKQMVERLTLERLCKFVVSTETISAGINLPAKRVVFPELKKVIKSKPRLLSSAEYHQMAGRAGRPQFDTEGIAITLAPEEVVQEIRKEIRDQAKAGRKPSPADEERIRKGAYSRAKQEAQRLASVTWDREAHTRLVEGAPAPLRSTTRVTAEQILAIGLPDLTETDIAVGGEEPKEGSGSETGTATGAAENEVLPAYMHLDIKTVIDNLLLDERSRWMARKQLEQVTRNLQALGVLDEHGQQIAGKMIGELRGIDGTFVFFVLKQTELTYEEARQLCEYLVDHDIVQRLLNREADDKRWDWIKNRLRERRREEPMITREEVEEEYERTFPRPLTRVEQLHRELEAQVPHPELHGGKMFKDVFARMDEGNIGFSQMVEENGLEHEEGNLFTYLARVMKVARTLKEVTGLPEFEEIEGRIRRELSTIDARILDER